MKNTIFTLAVVAIAIVCGTNAFAKVHHKQNGNALELTEDSTRIHRLTKAISQSGKFQIQIAHFQKHSDKFVVSAIYKTDVGTTLGRNHNKLISNHHFSKAAIHREKADYYLNLKNIAVTHLENQLVGIWNNFHTSNISKNIGEAFVGYG